MEHNGFEFVDLGLPSGLKWATCNVGANNPWEYGDYFQWGSITPDTDNVCDWAHAPFNGGNTEYNADAFNAVKDEVYPDGILAPEYDAAHVNMGGNWHMPTREDILELLDNTTNEWVTNYEGTGVNGRKFTSKTDSSKYIFIPSAGYRDGSSFYLNRWYFPIYLRLVDVFSSGRYCGFSVRGVFNNK